MAYTRWMALGCRCKILHAVVNHLDGMAGLESQQSRMGSEGRRIILFAAKGAAGFSLDDADLVFGQIKDREQRPVHVVRTLQRAPHRYSICLAPLSDDTVVFNVEMLLRAGAIFTLDNVHRVSPCGIHIALLEKEALDYIVRAPDNYILPFALFNRENWRQRFIFDTHRSDGLAQLVLVRMGQQDDGLVAMTDYPVREAGLVGEDELNMIFPGNIRRGDDCKFGPIDALVEADGANESARNRASHSSPWPHALAVNVVHVTGTTEQLVHSFLAGDGSANDAGFRIRAHGGESLKFVRVEA